MGEMQRSLTRSEIIGSSVTAIHQQHRVSVDGLDQTSTFYTLNNGITLMLPLAHWEFEAVTIPPGAKELDPHDAEIARILNVPIKSIYVIREEDGDIDPFSLLVELSSGDCFCDLTTAPHGLGWTGVRVLRHDEIDWKKYSDYWPA